MILEEEPVTLLGRQLYGRDKDVIRRVKELEAEGWLVLDRSYNPADETMLAILARCKDDE